MEREYVPNEDEIKKILMNNCIGGLTQYAVELTKNDQESSVNKVARLRTLVEEIAAYWGLEDDCETNIDDIYLKAFDEKVEAAKQGTEISAATQQEKATAVYGLCCYGLEMVAVQGRDAKGLIKEAKDFMMEIACHWNVITPKLNKMNNTLTKELVLMEIPENCTCDFTHIIITANNGEEVSDFFSGFVYDSEYVENTDIYQKFIEDIPDLKYVEVCFNGYKIGNMGNGENVCLSKEALELMRSIGKDFLDNDDVGIYYCNRSTIHHDNYPDMKL